MVLPVVKHANESLKWCFAAKRGAVNDVSILSHNNLNFRGIPFTIGLYVRQPTDCAHAYGGRSVGISQLPSADGDGTHGYQVGFTQFSFRNAHDCDM